MGIVLLHCERLAKYKKNLVYVVNLNVPIKLTLAEAYAIVLHWEVSAQK